jgi:hypothetical protein
MKPIPHKPSLALRRGLAMAKIENSMGASAAWAPAQLTAGKHPNSALVYVLMAITN